MRIVKLVLSIILIGVSAQASAGNLYRCLGSDGIPNYTSKKVPGATCTVVAKSSPEPAPKPAPVAVAPVPVVATPTTSTPAAPAATPDGATVLVAPTTTPAVNTTAAAPKPKAAAGAPKFLKMGSSTTYSYIDENGIKNYSSRKPKGIANVVATRIEYPIFSQPNCYACGVTTAGSVNFGSVKLNTLAYAAEIKAASQAYGVEEAVVRAIIHAESAYRPHVQSNKGAQGLMQLIPATAKRFGVSDSFDPAQNIDGGVQYLAWLLKRYGQDVTLAAAAYNAGEGAVDRYGGVPPYRETQNYVVRVGQLAERYRKAL